MKKNALIFVFDKTGIVDFSQGLRNCGYELTVHADVAEILHRSAIDGFTTISNDDFFNIDLEPFEIIVVNTQSFAQWFTSEHPLSVDKIIDVAFDAQIEFIKNLAKNYRNNSVLIDPLDYDNAIQSLNEYGKITDTLKIMFVCKVFEYVAHIDTLIATCLRKKQQNNDFPRFFTVTYEKSQGLRYGENPHQAASYYKEAMTNEGTLADAEQLSGSDLSFNNINDSNIAISLLKEFTQPAAVAVKHANPCGVSISDTILEAFNKAYDADSISAFDSVVALNREVDLELATRICHIFTGLVIAPQYTSEALSLLKQNQQKIKVLQIKKLTEIVSPNENDMRKVLGGLLIQKTDSKIFEKENIKCITKRTPTEYEMRQLEFAWIVAKHTKCNAIVLASNNATVGVGPGQMNRITALNIAIERGEGKTKGSVMASDGFFFQDCVIAASKAGVTAIIQPGGSNDSDLVEECDKTDISMLVTGMRHFKH